MTVRVLGPLDTDGPPLSPRERTILSALIVRRTRTVSPDELADACWGARPPQTWAQQIQNAIAKIRARLGKDTVRTVAAEYLLGIPDDALDVVQFEREVSRARRHGLEGTHDRAIAAYRRALQLWRGDPLPDVRDWPPARAEAMRLDAVRADAEEELLDARLRAGEDASAIPDAERLVQGAPLREHRWAILALANYRAGRQAEAIAVIRSARAQLAEQLGLDLGRELRELESDILRQNPVLERAHPARPAPTAAASAVCPYRGLIAYDNDDAELFFGRDSDVDALFSRTRPGSIVAIVGPSGSGKSSVLRAGLVPRLREHGRQVHLITPDVTGIAALHDILAGGAATIAIDQAEELLAHSLDDLQDLGALARTWLAEGGTLVLTLRSDFLDRATALPEIGAALGKNLYALSPMDEARLRRTIVGPAEASGLVLETGLTEVILRDAGDSASILPALSHALASTWSRRDGSTLTIAGYEGSGGIAGAIAQSAEQVYRSLSAHGQEVCRSLMMRLIERTPEGATVRRRVPLDALTSDATRRTVVEALVTARLVTIDGDSAIVAHESVGRAWPRLDGWLTDDADDARLLRHIEAAAAAWDGSGRRDDDLMRGARLQGTMEWRDRTGPELTGVERVFLERSSALHRDEVRELEVRATRDRAVNRRLRLALSAAGALLVVALVASGVAVLRGADAVEAAEDARIDALTTAALSSATGRETASLLAAELFRRWPDDPRTQTALEGALAQSAGLVRTVRFPEDASIAASVIPGTRTALVTIDTRPPYSGGQSTYATQIIDLTTGSARDINITLPVLYPDAERAQTGPDLSRRGVVVSADGSTALIHTERRPPGGAGLCCESLLTATPLRAAGSTLDSLPLSAQLMTPPALTPDGSRAYVIVEGATGPAKIDLSTRQVTTAPAAPIADDLRLQHLALIGDRLYLGAWDHVRVYDAETLEYAGRIDLPGAAGVSKTGLHVGSDGEGGLLALSYGAGARIALPSGAVTWARPGHGCSGGVALTPTGLACSRNNDGIWLVSLDTGEPIRRLVEQLPRGVSTVQAIAGVPEVVTVTTRDPAVIRRWRPDGGPPASADPEQLRDSACALAARQITPDEWEQYFGAEPYAQTCTLPP